MRLRLDAIKYTILFLGIEMQNLEFESKKIRIENTRVKFGKFFTKLCFIYFFYSLSAFIIPKNILDISPVCLNFVNFMKSYFPNIEIIGSISPYTQLSEFYVSYYVDIRDYYFCGF